ncbi:MAG: YfhO family protein, partial [Bacteroidales bacterium]|nr:YfhO family protein [Bacteroidales bacterium]
LTPKIGCIWLNINTFNKQIAQDGYNPLILSNYAFLRDSMPDVLLRFGQNPVVYFADSLVFKPEILKNGNAQKWVFIPEKNRSDSFSLGHNDSADIVYNQVFNPHFMVFQSQTTTSRFLVFQQNFYTGWHLFIDGNAATFFRVNHAFMGAKIPAGSHKIEWVFRPKMILIGFWISLVSLLFSLIMILLPEKRTTD